MVLKLAPPLVATEAQIDQCVDALKNVIQLAHHQSAFWGEALGLARRVANV